MALQSLLDEFRPAVEAQLKEVVDRCLTGDTAPLHHMLAYHMGWEGEGAGPDATGKRLRPAFLLLTCAAAGGSWRQALPAAAAVELVHNFSLIHDDIQDNSRLRRGRPTLWALWGVPQAINAGDTLFTLAFMALQDLQRGTPPETVLCAAGVLQKTCLQLTQGQFMDLAYEARGDLTLEAYWPMVDGKTAALLSACTGIGALVGGAGEERRENYRRFGRLLGLAFQAQDDLLGIWGDAALTGKSAESDLLSGKKSLPVLYGLSQEGEFARRWAQGPVHPEEVSSLAAQLEETGARQYTQDHANRLTEEALKALEDAEPQAEAGEALRTLALRLLQRQS